MNLHNGLEHDPQAFPIAVVCTSMHVCVSLIGSDGYLLDRNAVVLLLGVALQPQREASAGASPRTSLTYPHILN